MDASAATTMRLCGAERPAAIRDRVASGRVRWWTGLMIHPAAARNPLQNSGSRRERVDPKPGRIRPSIGISRSGDYSLARQCEFMEPSTATSLHDRRRPSERFALLGAVAVFLAGYGSARIEASAPPMTPPASAECPKE